MESKLAVCPFCSLHCDDVVFGPMEFGAMESVKCLRANDAFKEVQKTSPLGRIGTEVAEPKDVVKYAVQRFEEKGPLNVATVGTDLETARALQSLAANGEIRLWLDDFPSAVAWRLATSRDGIVSATIGDIRRHADVVWMIGDVSSGHPRIAERIRLDAKIGLETSTLDAETLADLYYDLRHGGEGHVVKPIREAKYLAIVLGCDAFSESQAIPIAELLVKMVWFLNQTKRAVALQLDGSATNRAVAAWQTNCGLSSLSAQTRRDWNVDVRIGDAFQKKVPVELQIGGCDPGRQSAQAFLPAATVGVDRAGVIMRGDSAVTMPLARIVERRGVETAPDILNRILGSRPST
ncbi:hypothetical protein CA13_14070 [Planctomycetes bacterium CA13]|uniref:Formyltransferase/hydrolase complex Fhc subunit B n=1 Tax=Novipirellula herctigrandis TaxID=2527986 RepID=A0A5C5YY45_9BACT|nr:hypothetical protein CA13_14070 [Planctomycetes bacterium CA13]